MTKKNYPDAISKSTKIDPADGLSAFYRLWDVFELEAGHQKLTAQNIRFWDKFTMSAPTFAVIAPGGILLLIFCVALRSTDISNVDGARGIITLLFNVTTVVIAVIVTLSNFLSTNNSEKAKEKFQRGK